MEVEQLARRQAIADWRDIYILEAAELLNHAGKRSCETFEEVLLQAGVKDMVWDPAGYAAPNVDRAMRQHTEPGLAELMARASGHLAGLHPMFKPLAEAMFEASVKLHYPATTSTSVIAPDPANPKEIGSQDAAPISAGVVQSLGDLGRSAAATIAWASESAGRTIKDISGMHSRLRNAGRIRIAQQWMGDTGEPRPVLAQVIAIIDETSTLARNAL